MTACETLPDWLKENLGPLALAPLTGTDSKALAAAVQIIELYSYDPRPSVLEAFGLIVRRMQPKNWQLAYHAIAHVMDWGHRPRVWHKAGLPPISAGRCKYEPRSNPSPASSGKE